MQFPTHGIFYSNIYGRWRRILLTNAWENGSKLKKMEAKFKVGNNDFRHWCECYCKSTTESASERILQIGQHFVKLWARLQWLPFVTRRVHTDIQTDMQTGSSQYFAPYIGRRSNKVYPKTSQQGFRGPFEILGTSTIWKAWSCRFQILHERGRGRSHATSVYMLPIYGTGLS